MHTYCPRLPVIGRLRMAAICAQMHMAYLAMLLSPELEPVLARAREGAWHDKLERLYINTVELGKRLRVCGVYARPWTYFWPALKFKPTFQLFVLLA